MSNYDEENELVIFDAPQLPPEQQLRNMERQFNRKLEDWHFKLLNGLGYHQVFSFFKNAKFKAGVIWFDGSTKNGIFCYHWAAMHFRDAIRAGLGSVQVCLAADRQVIKSFYTTNEGCLTKGEVLLMMKLAARGIAGEKIDSYAELNAYRLAKPQP